MEKYRICLVCERYQLFHWSYSPFHEALEKQFDLFRYFIEGRWPRSITEIVEYERFDAVIWFVRFKKLVNRPQFDWEKYEGLRMMYDHDTCQNFPSVLGKSKYQGMWPEIFNRNGFQILIGTGKEICNRLEGEGVRTSWLPKAYDGRKFFNKKELRDGICYFGELYPSREEMLSYLRKKGVVVTTHLRYSLLELNDFLNRYEICLICNMIVDTKRNIFYPGTEVMIKNFEVPASGCVPFCDDIPELFDLGFKDGETAVLYRNFDELYWKLCYYLENPELLSQISEKATKLCIENHTWEHRAETLEQFITKELGDGLKTFRNNSGNAS